MMGGRRGVVSAALAKKTVPNLFNTATVRDGKQISSSTGIIQSVAGWGVSAFIPVVAGKKYTISGTRGRAGLSFFKTASDTNVVSGSYNAWSVLPFTVTAPEGANFIVIALYYPTVPTYSNVQVEEGVYPTQYYPYGTLIDSIVQSYLPVQSASASLAKLVLSASGTSYIENRLDTGDLLKQNINPFLLRSNHDYSEVFNFGSIQQINNITVRNGDDSVAPFRMYSTTIGANHGYYKTKCTAPAHGKTLLDVGSIYKNPSNKEYVIVDVPDANTIVMTARTDNTTLSAALMTHVSGGTATASFTPTAVSSSNLMGGGLYPVIKNRKTSISCDGIPVYDYENTYTYNDNITIVDNYEIMEKNSIVEWLITQHGTATKIDNYNGTSDVSVSISYVFDTSGGCTIYHDFLALNNVAAFQDIMFLQGMPLTDNTYGRSKVYVPKTLPFTQDSVAYDFSTPYLIPSGFSIPNRLDFTPATRCDATGHLADRVICLNDSYGFATGYLPTRSADPAVRRSNAATKALQISTNGKIYMSCIDNTSKVSLTAGDYFSVVAYKNWFKKSANRSAQYVVKSNDGDYLYCDWHITISGDRVTLPPELQGKAYTVVEKSANVTIKNTMIGNSVVFDVAAAGSYGFAVLKF